MVIHCKPNDIFFSQGAPAQDIFYIRSGRAKLTVVSDRGKEATIMLLSAGDFAGEEAITGYVFRKSTATAMTACSILKIGRVEMLRAMEEEPGLSEHFLKLMLARSMRAQADLIDHLFNSSERRLARALLLMAHYGNAGEPKFLIPRVTQETLAEMIGTTRSRVSFFMNRFRKFGYIEYHVKHKGQILIHKSLLEVVLHDQWPQTSRAQA